MAQWVKECTAKPDYLSSIPELFFSTHGRKRKPTSISTEINKYNKIIKNIERYED